MATVLDTRSARAHRTTRLTTVIADRSKAFASARRHSRVVRILRVALPVTAALILVAYTLVILANWRLGMGGLNVGSVSITADDLTMKDPSYFGTTKEGGRFEVRARRAILGLKQNAPVKLIDVTGNVIQSDNATTKLKSKHGLFDNAKGELELFDGIEIEGSNGLMARLSRALVYSKENKIVSNDPVSANTPTGSLQAAKMVMNTKSRLTQFKGNVAVRLVPSASQAGIGTGKDAKQPINIHSEELDVDDTQKTAHFRGGVGVLQGETMMNTPYLFVKYDGKAGSALGSTPPAGADQGTRVTFIWARNGVEVSLGEDRRVTSDLADFDVTADTALFVGNVNATQDKNTLRGGKLFIDRKAGKTRLDPEAGGDGRVAASFHQSSSKPAPKAARDPVTTAAGSLLGGSFKADPNAPMEVEANSLDIYDASKKAVFNGNVIAQQGDFIIRTAELSAFYSGQAFGMSGGEDKTKGELNRIEARRKVIIVSKDGRTAVSDWANFDVKANTALMGGGVTVVRDKDVAEGPRLKIDLTTGMYRFELESGAEVPAASAPAVSSSASRPEDRSCPPGKQCMLFYPKDVKEKAKDILKKNVPEPRPQ
jgi:lipopolysaccharide export system protein LptA